MVQFYTFGVYYQWRTQGRGPGSAFLETPPPTPLPPLSQGLDLALVELKWIVKISSTTAYKFFRISFLPSEELLETTIPVLLVNSFNP